MHDARTEPETEARQAVPAGCDLRFIFMTLSQLLAVTAVSEQRPFSAKAELASLGKPAFAQMRRAAD